MSLKLTKKRQEILKVLKSSKEALSAKEIHSQLKDTDLTTVYRTLDFLITEKIVSQLNLGGDEAKFEYQNEPHHHAVCTECEKVIHFKVSDQKIKKLLKFDDFAIEDIELTVKGLCRH